MGNSPDTTKNGDSRKSSIHEKDIATTTQEAAIKPESIPATKSEPLAPPPRPDPVVNTPDYFSSAHTNPAPQLNSETNPFEYSFTNGNGGEVQTPGGTKLPSVAALTSPNGFPGSITPSFWGSLRSGPLSPAMLSGPAKGGDDYFSDNHHLRGGFPTPNESGMRSGLTPGGGGSMFPETTPGSLLGFGSGGATPSTMEFHRTALNAAKQSQTLAAQHQSVTSQPQESQNLDVKAPTAQFDQHDPQEAANSLFMLANNRTQPQPPNHYAQAPQMAVHGHPQSSMHMNSQSQQSSPTMANRTNGSISTASGRAPSEMSVSDSEQQPRPNTRGKGKRTSTQTTGRGKANDTPKGPASKKVKANNGHSMPEPADDEEEEVLDLSKDEYNSKGQKMTEDEKRKNFLERNRVAALKCRQRKKQWLANLQHKVEVYSTENDALNAQINGMRVELEHLKGIIHAHKDCSLSQSGMQGIMHQQAMDGYNGQMNPYGMAATMNQQQAMVPNNAMDQRRFS